MRLPVAARSEDTPPLAVRALPGVSGGRAAAPVRVAVVYSSDFERVSPGGIMTSVKELVARLDHRFHVVMACVGDQRETERIGARLRRTEITVLPVISAARRPPSIPLNIVFTAGLLRAKGRIVREADVIHAHRMELALPFVIRKRKPVVLTVAGSSAHHASCTSGLLRWKPVQRLYDLVEGFVFSRVDVVHLLSQEAHEYYRRRHPRQRQKFRVIPNFIDTSTFTPADRGTARPLFGLGEADLAVVYAGRLSPEKRVDHLIAAFAEVARVRPTARLLIGGAGPEEARLRRQAAALALERVRFLGTLSRPDVRLLLSSADVVVLPSVFEGFPMAALEALACGVPVVATDVGGVRDILTGGLTDFVLRSVEPKELAARIVVAADRREAARDLCLARARQFDATRILPQIEAVYSSLMRRPR